MNIHYPMKTRLLMVMMTILTITISGCGLTTAQRRQLYFEQSSTQQVGVQELPGSKTQPPQYTICGSKEHPCFSPSRLIQKNQHPVIQHKRQIKKIRRVHKKSHKKVIFHHLKQRGDKTHDCTCTCKK